MAEAPMAFADAAAEEAEARELAQRMVAEALRRGATAAEAGVSAGRELSVTVRMGETESLKQARGRGLGLRVFNGRQAGASHSSDWSPAAVSAMIGAALDMAAAVSADPFTALPEAEELGEYPEPLDLYSPACAELGPAAALDWARRAEAAALGADARLTNSEGASFEAGEGLRVLANSHGFLGSYRRSWCAGSVMPIAMADGARQRDYWYTLGRGPGDLEAPEAVGRTAAARALRRLGARKAATARVPVVFDPQTARSLLQHLAAAASGDAIYREASFLRGQLGAAVAVPGVNIFDDGTRRRGPGSAPFDGEGAPTRRTPIVAEGRLHSYLLNSYAARKLNLRTTGNAAGGSGGGIGTHNFWMEPGAASPQQIIASVPNGLYVTELIGFGFNPVTGDYSRGACGQWIENGALAYPVEEITIAGNFGEMLRHIAAIGNDLEFRSAFAAPTLLIEGMTVAGR